MRRFPRVASLLAALPLVFVLTAERAVSGQAEAQAQARSDAAAGVRFEITIGAGQRPSRNEGRLFVVLGPPGEAEPRQLIGRTGVDSAPIFAVDVADVRPGSRHIVDATAYGFPVVSLDELEAGDYRVQALFDSNIDLKSPNAPGNLYSDVRDIRVDPSAVASVELELTHRVPDEVLPEPTEYLRFVKLRSSLLSEFHGRPIYLRAGVVLPRDYEQQSARRYPLRVRIGGYGSRYTRVQRMLADDSEFREAWLSDAAPRMILLHLDGDGPFGDPYQVNSANHGPYGSAITQELIPHVEREFRAIGRPHARVLDGGSTGGWVSLALQVFYPDFFNGAWSYCPDGVDFRAFQLIDIYADDNAYVNDRGFERPSARDVDGDVRFTMRHEARLENLIGSGDSWTMSGRQWGAWNATYGPRGDDGRPVPLWDPESGAIDQDVLVHWERYDVRRVLERDWSELGPKLRGKINIWIGDADNYFLNNAVHLLDEFLASANPPYAGRIVYGPGEGHCWVGVSALQIMQEMGARVSR